MSAKTVTFSGARTLPAIGQGTWYMGEKASLRKTEADALRAGIDLGLRLIDTAEMYAEGGAEEVVGEAIKGLRDNVYLVSKVYPWNAGGQKGMRHVKPACDGLAPTASICICCTGAAVLTWKTRLN
jgi:diketogulonate reductase-like aldo/keto reductase